MEYNIESVIRRQHVCKRIWYSVLGERLVHVYLREGHDRHTASVMKGEDIVGHVP